jgi:hypothetical protein
MTWTEISVREVHVGDVTRDGKVLDCYWDEGGRVLAIEDLGDCYYNANTTVEILDREES